MIYVKCEFNKEGNLKGISCSCRKLESFGTPLLTHLLCIGPSGSKQAARLLSFGKVDNGGEECIPIDKEEHHVRVFYNSTEVP